MAIDIDQSLKGKDAGRTLELIKAQRGATRTIKVDNRLEFISKTLDRCAYDNGAELDFSRPGRPIDNGKVEPFTGRLPNSPASTVFARARGRSEEEPVPSS